jgi:hypothetical protein
MVETLEDYYLSEQDFETSAVSGDQRWNKTRSRKENKEKKVIKNKKECVLKIGGSMVVVRGEKQYLFTENKMGLTAYDVLRGGCADKISERARSFHKLPNIDLDPL